MGFVPTTLRVFALEACALPLCYNCCPTLGIGLTKSLYFIIGCDLRPDMYKSLSSSAVEPSPTDISERCSLSYNSTSRCAFELVLFLLLIKTKAAEYALKEPSITAV